MRIRRGHFIDIDKFPKDLPVGLRQNLRFTGTGVNRNTGILIIKTACIQESEGINLHIEFSVLSGKGGLQAHQGKVTYIGLSRARRDTTGRDYLFHLELNNSKCG